MVRLAVDLHSHTVASRAATLTLAELCEQAGSAGVDVLAVTEHDAPGPAPVLPRGDGPLLLAGVEHTTDPAGHRVVLADGTTILAHPFAPYPGGSTTRGPRPGELVEVWNGAWRSDAPWQADNETALTWWAGLLAAAGPDDPVPVAVGSSDAHLPGQPGTPVTVVDVPIREATAALAEVRAGRSWILRSAAVAAELRCSRGAVAVGPGQLLPGAGPVRVTVTVAGTGPCTMTVLGPDGPLLSAGPRRARPGAGPGAAAARRGARPGRRRARAEQPGARQLLTRAQRSGRQWAGEACSGRLASSGDRIVADTAAAG